MNPQDVPSTLIGLFVDRASRFPDRPFLSASKFAGIETLSYAKAAKRICGVAEWLVARGFNKGDRVICYVDEAEPCVWFYLACAATGVIPVPLSPSYSLNSVRQLVGHARAKALFTSSKLIDRVKAIDTLSIYLPDRGSAARDARALVPTEPENAVERLATLSAAICGDDVYMFQPTSGSTGVPKLVMRCHRTFARAGRLCVGRLEPTEQSHAGLLVQSLTHGAGQYCLAGLLYLGGKICVPTTVDTFASLEEVERLAPTFIVMVPRVIRSLYEQHRARYGAEADRTPFCGPHMRLVSTGGAPLDESIVVALEKQGIVFIQAYGSSECCIVAITEWGRRRAGVIGPISDDVELRIASDGELLVRSPAMMAGYFGDEEMTRSAFDSNGFYKTGDLALIEGNELRILGRKRDLFNSSEGSNIYPVRIEELLEGLPWVAQAMLVGDGRPFIVAFLVLRDGGSSDEATGFLDRETHRTEYARAEAALAMLNQSLETFERIRRVALFGRPFPKEIYEIVGHSKARRDRKNFIAGFGERIVQLYASSPSNALVELD